VLGVNIYNILSTGQLQPIEERTDQSTQRANNIENVRGFQTKDPARWSETGLCYEQGREASTARTWPDNPFVGTGTSRLKVAEFSTELVKDMP
jgi:hypothetical protein